MKKVRDVVDNNVVENTKFNTLKTKVNSLEKKIEVERVLKAMIDLKTHLFINQHLTH